MKRSIASAVTALSFLALLSLTGDVLAAKPAPSQAVNINTASVQELMTVPGLGAAKAKAIVDFRATAPFQSPNDLIAVKGIGEKLFAKIAPYVTTSTEASSGAAGKATR